MSSGTRMLIPVTLPPGLAKPVTRPAPTGSPTVVTTIGMVDVAFFAANAEGMPPPVTIRSTFSRTRSTAKAGRRYCIMRGRELLRAKWNGRRMAPGWFL